MEELLPVPALPVGFGLTYLEIQQRVLRFLLDCCKSILHDVATDDLLTGSIVPESTETTGITNSTSMLADLAAEGPHRLPKGLDLPRLKAIFSAKRSAAEDHMWALREDPSYFADCVQELMDHRFEQLKDAHGRPHPNLQSHREHLVWEPVITTVVVSSEYYLEVWDTLCDIIADVEAELTKRITSLSRDETLPEELFSNLSYLKNFLQHVILGPVARLQANL